MSSGYTVPMKLPHLEAALRDCGSASAEVRWVAAMALGVQDVGGRGESVKALEALCDDEVQEVRAQAIEGLAEQVRAGAEISSRRILEGLKDDSDMVRCAAVANLDLFMDDAAARASQMLADSQPSVRATAARMLADLRAGEYLENLARLLNDDDDVVSEEVAFSMVILGDVRGRDRVIDMLREGLPTAIRSAQALAELGDHAAVSALKEVVSGWLIDPELKSVAAAALVRCGSEEGRNVLGKMLSSRRETVRMAALQALVGTPVTGMADAVADIVLRSSSMEASAAISALLSLWTVESNQVERAFQSLEGKLDSDLAGELEEGRLELEGDGE